MGTYKSKSCWINQNEAASCAWIDFFFLVPQGKQLVLSHGKSIPATPVKPFDFDAIGGYIDRDYTAIEVSASGAGKLEFL